ncbi:MAG: hypothetical protein DMG89_11110 [Acidobacteria bacterium]|nr:MAG: hypothetical protein DMG89_11110 [Acidobacteriota bacterium]
MKEHEDASRIADTTTVKTSNPPDLSRLVHHYRQWSELDDKKLQLRQAKQDSESAAITFTTRCDALESNVKTQKQEVPGTVRATCYFHKQFRHRGPLLQFFHCGPVALG